MLVLAAIVGAAVAAPKPAPPPAPLAGDEAWQATIDRVAPSVLTIRMDRPRAFEGSGRTNAQATGFVVDAEQGLILTNRHVVTEGPVVARGVFQNNEEVDLVPVYRDPVHDFGLFHYDPSKLRFNHPVALPLDPAGAKVGVEVRVLGNDSGERLSILDGTIARIDRPAPVYGGGFSDYDTFYVQAASSTSGGSSGSPVVDLHGDVIALNAGGKTTAATSFYLRLEPVVRALALVRAGQPVARGTLQTQMEYTSYDEAGRLGLTDPTEAAARAENPTGTGVLVIREVLPKGPADGQLQVGDILVSIDDHRVLDFIALEQILDDHVGRSVHVAVERAGKPVSADLTVDDLNRLVPSRLVEIGGGTVHDLSIHQARGAQIAIDGVYVADAGRMLRTGGVGEGSVITEIDGLPIESLDDFVTAIAAIPDSQPFAVRFFGVDRPTQVSQTSVRMDRRWFPVRACTRKDVDGSWPCEELTGPAEPAHPSPPLHIGFSPVEDKRAALVQASLVGVKAEVPYPIAGVSGSTYTGAGLVVDAVAGLVVVDRDTVPVAASDVTLIVAGGFEIPASVVALHENHDLAVIRYDPKDLGTVVLKSAVLSTDPLGPGDKATFVGLEQDGQVDANPVEVTRLQSLAVPSGGAPRFRETNLDVVALRESPRSENGVLVDKKGRVQAFWASFSFTDGTSSRSWWAAIPTDVVRDVIELSSGGGRLRTLGWELGALTLPRALDRGLPADEAERLVTHDPERREVLQVIRIETGDPLQKIVRTGDLILAVDGVPVTRFREVERALVGKDTVKLLVCRGGALSRVDVPTRPLQPIDVDRVVSWAGVRIHEPDRSARLEGVAPARPYIVWLEPGSPAGRAQLYPQRSILAVDGIDTPTLDAFLAAVDGKEGGSVRLTVVDRRGERNVVAIEPDDRFFPTEELVRVDGVWQRRPPSAGVAAGP